MTADPYGTSSEIPAAACTWPDHGDVGCPRCAALLACLAQVPGKALDGSLVHSASALASWALRCGYREQTQMPSDILPGVLSPDHDQFRVWCAQQVADRLLAWLRWPGCSHPPEAEIGHPVECDWCGAQNVLTPPVHPLDGTDVAELRPALVHSGPLEPGCSTVLTGHGPDWPAVAVVADYLSTCGGWRWVHDWRPSHAKGDRIRAFNQALLDGAVSVPPPW